jgi:hypothetical protein
MIGTHLQQQLQLFATAATTFSNSSCKNYLQQQPQLIATAAAPICKP